MNRYQLRTNRFEAMIRRYGVSFSELNALIDLLADARHWCDRHGEDYSVVDRFAYRQYLDEINEPVTSRRRS